jgi:hypothetical protein
LKVVSCTCLEDVSFFATLLKFVIHSSRLQQVHYSFTNFAQNSSSPNSWISFLRAQVLQAAWSLPNCLRALLKPGFKFLCSQRHWLVWIMSFPINKKWFSQIWLQAKYESNLKKKPTFYIFGYLLEPCMEILANFLKIWSNYGYWKISGNTWLKSFLLGHVYSKQKNGCSQHTQINQRDKYMNIFLGGGGMGWHQWVF